MPEDRSRPGGEAEAAADEDQEIEITEVHGLPADAPPPSGLASAEGEEAAVGEAAAPGAGGGAGDGEAEERLQAELEKAREDLLRVRAEFDNYRKRQSRERADFARHAAAELVERILPVLDNFKRALAADPGQGDTDSYQEGVRLIHRQLTEVLEGAGLAPIETAGQPFDPNLHEAVAREETDAVEPNTITAELEPGYRFRDRLLKPARVRVAVAPRES